MKKLGVTSRDFFSPSSRNGNGKPKSKIVKIYPYHDVDGALQFEVVRFEPKDFKQRRPNGITSAELAAGKYNLDYFVEWLLVQGQPCVIAGPKKALKTNISIDLALSLSIGEKFLGVFNVPAAVRVGLMSGESGEATIQETARRIANSKHWSLDNFYNVVWSFTVPQLGNLEHTAALREFSIEHELDVLIIDPTYLALAEVGDSAGNMFVVGRILKSLVDLSAETGVTPILIHHLRKTIADPFVPPELEDIAWAEFQEFVRQWLLIERRAKYDPDNGGHHELWLNVGGSSGHSGLWGVNIDEGTRQDVGGRSWNVDVLTVAQARGQANEAAEESREEAAARKRDAQQQQNREAVLKAMRAFPDGETQTKIRTAAGLSGVRFGPVWADMLIAGEVENAGEIKKSNDRNYDSFRAPGRFHLSRWDTLNGTADP